MSTPKLEPSEERAARLATAVKELQQNMPAMLDHLRLRALFQRHYFNELRKQGFTEGQSLELCKSAPGV